MLRCWNSHLQWVHNEGHGLQPSHFADGAGRCASIKHLASSFKHLASRITHLSQSHCKQEDGTWEEFSRTQLKKWLHQQKSACILSFAILWYLVRDKRPWNLTPAFNKQHTVQAQPLYRQDSWTQTLRACGHIGKVQFTVVAHLRWSTASRNTWCWG